ncbi:Toprim domain-containing protein [Rhizobiales bacterium GAS191]|nr:Toprim domain-containing protein [Rhizobiales bacterium GAS191]
MSDRAAFEAALALARSLPVKAGLLGHISNLKRLSGELIGPCPRCGGRDRFAVNPKRGWNCRGCQVGGKDAVSLAMHVASCGFIGAVEILTGQTFTAGAKRPEPATPTSRDDRADKADAEAEAGNARNLAAAARIIGELVPIAGTFGETYLLEQRGIDSTAIANVLGRTDAIGSHPALYFSCEGHELHGRKLRGLVAILSDPLSAKPTGAISRTFIGPDGSKVGKAKTLGRPAGIVRLSPDQDVAEGLYLAEGLETALAAMAIGLCPMWSAGSASLMRSFPVLAGIQCLTIIADHDAKGAGEKAAHEVADRWRAAGRETRVLRSQALGDLNDALRREGTAA